MEDYTWTRAHVSTKQMIITSKWAHVFLHHSDAAPCESTKQTIITLKCTRVFLHRSDAASRDHGLSTSRKGQRA